MTYEQRVAATLRYLETMYPVTRAPPPPPQHFVREWMSRPLRMQTSRGRRMFWDVVMGRVPAGSLVEEWEEGTDTLLVCLYLAYAPPEAVRHVLQLVWQAPRRQNQGLHAWCQRQTHTPDMLHRIFRYAAFPLPEGLPDEVTVYRGLCAFPNERSMEERALDFTAVDPVWTTDRDIACAMATAFPNKEAVVVRCVVPRSGILFHGPGFGGSELDYAEVLFEGEPFGEIDGTRAEWRNRQDYVTARRMDCPVVGPVGTGSDMIENLKQAMDVSGRSAMDQLLRFGDGGPTAPMAGYKAEVLARAIPIPLQGAVTVALFKAGAPKENVRGILHHTWVRGYQRITGAVEDEETLYALLRYADFPIPADLPNRVTVYRGSAGVGLDQARRGRSWTLHRDMACWFATQGARERGYLGTPLVIRREVRLSESIFFGNDGWRSELVFDPARFADDLSAEELGVVDGDAADWHQRAEAYRLQLQRGGSDNDSETRAAVKQAKLDANVRFQMNSTGNAQRDFELALGGTWRGGRRVAD